MREFLEEIFNNGKTLFYAAGGMVLLFFFLGVMNTIHFSKEENILPAGEPVREKETPPRVQEPPALPVEVTRIEKRFEKGDNLIGVLQAQGISHGVAYQAAQAVKPVYDLKDFVAGREYTIYRRGTDLERFVYRIARDRYLEVFREEKGEPFSCKLVNIPTRMERSFVRGVIESSLFQAILDCGEKPELADILAGLYEYDIDFNRDLRRGDRFALLVEKRYLEGEFIKYGPVLAAEFHSRGESVFLYRYTDPEGNVAYFHPGGKAVKKMFRRCPLPFMRVTSRFGWRTHPVAGFSDRHNGVDLGAPAGTRVLATASGVVQKVSYSGTNGRYVAIRHPNRYHTYYLHLRGFAKGIKPGTRVAQGQVIGYVGSTGRTTGPHLHYGVQKNGKYINPLSLKSPSGQPVKKAYLEDFFKCTAEASFLLARGKIQSSWSMKLPVTLEFFSSPIVK